MATNKITLGPMYIPDPTIGRPISGAQLFIGEPDLVSQDNQKQVSIQQEDGSIVNISQPLQTGAGGVILFQGSPVIALVDGQYSMQVLDSSDAQIYYVPKAQDLGPLLSDDSVGNGSDRVAWTGRNPDQTVTEGLDDHETRIGDLEVAEADVLRGNVLIGGDFPRAPWQRGESFTGIADDEYTADRWVANLDGASNVDITREDLTEGTTGLGFTVNTALRYTAVGAANVGDNLAQRIEDARTLAGKSGRAVIAIRGSASITVPLLITQNFGTGGSPSSEVETDFGDLSVTTSWQDLDLTGDIPVVTGKTFGTDENSRLDFKVVTENMTTGQWVEISFAALHEDSEDRTLERRQFGEELALAKRYFEITDGTQYLCTAVANGVSTVTGDLQYAQKRVFPTITIDGDATDFTYEIGGSTATSNFGAGSTVDFDKIRTKACRMRVFEGTSTPFTVGDAVLLSAGSAQIILDAEL